ncbi:hypothetical protein QTP88_008675 [Uroleucon formosanum]
MADERYRFRCTAGCVVISRLENTTAFTAAMVALVSSSEVSGGGLYIRVLPARVNVLWTRREEIGARSVDFKSLRYFLNVRSHGPFSLAVQDERGPRKSKLPKIAEINTVEPENWKTRSEYVYEIGAQIFLTSLRQCRFNESMAILPNAVQNEILNRTWHQSFVLMAAFWPTNLITLLSGSNSSIEHIVATLIASHRAMRLDSIEYKLVLTLVLCRPAEFRNDLTAIGTNAKDALMKHAAFKSPTRYYGILACILSVTEDIAGYIKIIFFEPSVRNVPMNHLVSVIT